MEQGRYLKKIIFFISSAIFVFHLAAEPNGEIVEIIDAYFRHLRNLEYEQAYLLLANEEKEGIELIDYLDYMAGFKAMFSQAQAVSDTLYALILEKYLEYRILEIKNENNMVKIELEIYIPNFYAIGFDLADKIPELIKIQESEQGMENKVNAALRRLYPRSAPVDISRVEYKIVTQNDKKYLLTGIRKDILVNKVRMIKEAAGKTRREGNLQAAIALYEKALAIDDQDLEIRKSLIECEVELEEMSRLLSRKIDPGIKKHLVIEEPALFSTGWGKNLYCTIKNIGAEAIVYIKLRIIYYSDNDNIIDSYSFSPMDISAFDSLQPGSEKRISENLMFFPDSDHWAGNKFQLEIIDYK